MLQITINIDHVNVLHLFSFTYSFVLVKVRQLFMRESTTWFFFKIIYYLKYVGFYPWGKPMGPTRPSCVSCIYCYICLWWDFPCPHPTPFSVTKQRFGYYALKLLNSTWIRGYRHYISKYTIYVLLEFKILHRDLGTCCTGCCNSKGMDAFPTPISLTFQEPWHTLMRIF